MKIAIVKPDHLGDFILATPAIRALRAAGHETSLFLATGNFALARHHFPDAELVPVDLPYLNRKLDSKSWSGAYRSLGRLREFDLVLFLRRDWFLQPGNFCDWTDYGLTIEDRLDRHQTQLEQAIAEPVCGVYNIDEMLTGATPRPYPVAPRSIVFAIGTGFPFKKWSPLGWVELAQKLLAAGKSVQILSGPGEIAESAFIARAAGLDQRRDVFVGGADFSALDQWLADHDATVAVDGGSAHLCSLATPVVTLFGPSPARRYAPTGARNRIVTRGLGCSPCVGFDARALNACMSRECMYGLRAGHVLEALMMRPALPGEQRMLDAARGVSVRFGVSAEAA